MSDIGLTKAFQLIRKNTQGMGQVHISNLGPNKINEIDSSISLP